MFLHPGLWDRRTWDGHLERYAGRYRVIRYDARGYGRSTRPEPGRPYSHVEISIAVMDAVEIERAALIGCSMGGATAVETASEHPSRVDALVLAAPGINGWDDLTAEEDADLDARYAPVEAAVERGDLHAARDAQLADLGAARDRRPRGSADPRDRVRQPSRADDGRERPARPRPTDRRAARGHHGADARAARRSRPDRVPACRHGSTPTASRARVSSRSPRPITC